MNCLGRYTTPAKLETHAQSLGQWPAGCLIPDNVLTLSEPSGPQQKQEWCGQAGSINLLSMWAPPRAKPVAKSSSQILGEARHLPTVLG